MPRWIVGVGVVGALVAGAVVVRMIVTGDGATESDLTASVQATDTGLGSPFACPDSPGFAAIEIPSPDELAKGVDLSLPTLDLSAALASVSEEYLFGESELELVAAAILCSLGDRDISPFGALDGPGVAIAGSGPAGVLASGIPLPAVVMAQADSGAQGGYNPETEQWEVSGSAQGSAEDSKPDANGARIGVDLEYTATAPKCWDEEGNATATVTFAGEVSRLSSDGETTTVEVAVELTMSFSDGSVSSETQIGAFRYGERDGETTFDWDLPALLYDDDDFATFAAAARTMAGFSEFTALVTYTSALERAYERDTLGGTSVCLEVILDPSELTLEPGESTGVVANVRDWKGRPIVVVVSAEAAQGTVSPGVGPSTTDGVWATTYTAPSADSDTDRVVFTAQRQLHVTRGYLHVGIIDGETWSFSMTTDVEEIAFLWDGLLTVGGGQVTGSGIGTVIGAGYCEVNSYTGPIAHITGTFTFEVTGGSTEDADAEFLTLTVDSTEAHIEFDYEDPRCGGFVEIARDFLKLVPTFPSYLRGFEIQVSDGLGFADLLVDPYVFEVDVARLGD